MRLSTLPLACRQFLVVLGIGVVLAVQPVVPFPRSPPAVQALQPTMPVAMPVALGLRIRDLQGAAHRTTREGQFVSDVPGIVTAIVPEGFSFTP